MKDTKVVRESLDRSRRNQRLEGLDAEALLEAFSRSKRNTDYAINYHAIKKRRENREMNEVER
tara:strand:- start:172 stop:360 length:189 start_codon:yes stop_codon:yes gene_type:complete